MCGRYSLFAPREDVERQLDATFAADFEPRYNAAPGQSLPVVTNEEPTTIRRLEWGLVPEWADDRSDFGLINARVETVAQKPAFADAYERRRCLVPADGFYEWPDDGPPRRVTLADESVFAMAGIYERWRPQNRQSGLDEFSPDGVPGPTDADVVETFAVLTTEPNDVVERLHDRMAVVLEQNDHDAWLEGRVGLERLRRPYAGRMRAYPVSTAVNDPKNDSPAVVKPAE